MDGKRTLCILEREPISSTKKERSPQMQRLEHKGLECSLVYPGNIMYGLLYLFIYFFKILPSLIKPKKELNDSLIIAGLDP